MKKAFGRRRQSALSDNAVLINVEDVFPFQKTCWITFMTYWKISIVMHYFSGLKLDSVQNLKQSLTTWINSPKTMLWTGRSRSHLLPMEQQSRKVLETELFRKFHLRVSSHCVSSHCAISGDALQLRNWSKKTTEVWSADCSWRSHNGCEFHPLTF